MGWYNLYFMYYYIFINTVGGCILDWELTRWRITINCDPGNWHKIHGNQKNECAGFKLII
jgi:hypothetical protein